MRFLGMNSSAKIKSRAALRRTVSGLKNQNKTIVFTNGCFDILHAGHVKTFEKARSLGDVLIVAINSDASLRRLKGPGRPLVGQKDRAVVAGIDFQCLSHVSYLPFAWSYQVVPETGTFSESAWRGVQSRFIPQPSRIAEDPRPLSTLGYSPRGPGRAA